MEILTPQKGTSFPSLIGEINQVGIENGRPFPLDKESSVRPAISSDVKRKHPRRVYSATKEYMPGVLWVYLKEVKQSA